MNYFKSHSTIKKFWGFKPHLSPAANQLFWVSLTLSLLLLFDSAKMTVSFFQYVEHSIKLSLAIFTSKKWRKFYIQLRSTKMEN